MMDIKFFDILGGQWSGHERYSLRKMKKINRTAELFLKSNST